MEYIWLGFTFTRYPSSTRALDYGHLWAIPRILLLKRYPFCIWRWELRDPTSYNLRKIASSFENRACGPFDDDVDYFYSISSGFNRNRQC